MFISAAGGNLMEDEDSDSDDCSESNLEISPQNLNKQGRES
jgi:hypothetical protein